MNTLTGPPVPDVGVLTFPAFVTDVCERFADNEALVFDDPLRDGLTVRWTYRTLLAEARRVAGHLRARDLEPGSRVGILMGNRPEAVAGFFGAGLAGCVAVPLSTFSARPELGFMLEDADIALVLTQSRLLARSPAEDVRAIGRLVAVIDEPGYLGEQAPLPSSSPDADEDGLITYSSGTTDHPKGMIHRHRSPAFQFRVQAGVFRRTEASRMWTALPIFWTAGINTAMGATLAAGGCWVMQETFDPGAALALMARERVDEPYCLPHQTATLEEHPAWGETDLSAMTKVFGKSAFARHPRTGGDTTWNMPIGYGLSETCTFFVAHQWDRPRHVERNSMGYLMPGNQLRIVDPESGGPVTPGDEGEFAVAGPTLLRQYVNRPPEATFDDDGFLHTGDVGYANADGQIYWTGRRTEMIKTAGANVSPAELEVQLRACPPVKLARAVGIPDPRLDQIVVLCVTLKDGATATEAEIQQFLRDRVASYKVPKRVLFFNDGDIPMTRSDTKVRDNDLVSLVTARLNGADG